MITMTMMRKSKQSGSGAEHLLGMVIRGAWSFLVSAAIWYFCLFSSVFFFLQFIFGGLGGMFIVS
jgi:hypothetical protein